MHVPPIIAMTGPAGSGKTYAARVLGGLLAHHGVRTETFGFADPLKELTRRALRAPVYMDDNEFKARTWLGITGREWLQAIGTDVVRKRNPGAWVEAMAARVAATLRGTTIVIPDLRFPNEADWVASQNGVVVMTMREGTLKGEAAAHASESALDIGYIHWVLDNRDDRVEDAWQALLGLTL